MSGESAPLPEAPALPSEELRVWRRAVMQRIITQPDSIADLLTGLMHRVLVLEQRVGSDGTLGVMSTPDFVALLNRQLTQYAKR